MKKILFYIDTLQRGGAQRVTANLVEYFYEKGYETVLINDYKPADDKPVYEVPEGVKIIYLRDGSEGNTVTKNISRIRNLGQAIGSEKPDVAVSLLGRANIRLLMAAGRSNTKKVVSVRNDPNREYGSSKRRRRMTGRLFQRADGCVFQTEEAAAYFPPAVREKSKIILNPVNEKFYQVVRSEKPKNIVSVGRLEPQKNSKMLIDAFAEIAGEFPDEHLIICGDGPMRAELEDHVSELGLDNRIDFLGNIDHVDQILADAKVFVLPSDYEGLPNALMEAMTAGVPCIATDCPCGGPRVLIQNEDQGILIPVGDTERLSSELQVLLKDSARQKVLSENARKRAEDFRADKVLGEWESYISETADR